ncbi:MAG: DinB family protein [Planctomycetota bacterium]
MPIQLLGSLDNARRQTLRLVDDLTEEQFFAKTKNSMHNAAWTVGHLMFFDTYIADLFSPEDVTIADRWAAAFGPGSTPNDAISNADKAELLAQLDRYRMIMLAAVGMLHEQDLNEPNPDASTRTNLPTIRDLLAYTLWHEAYHAGQLSSWRKLNNLPTVGIAFLD